VPGEWVKGPAWIRAAMKLWGAVTPVPLLMAWLASCSPGQSEVGVSLDDEFFLPVGQRVRVEGEDLRMEFLLHESSGPNIG